MLLPAHHVPCITQIPVNEGIGRIGSFRDDDDNPSPKKTPNISASTVRGQGIDRRKCHSMADETCRPYGVHIHYYLKASL